MKKKILSVLLVAALSLTTITGCGSDETGNDASQTSTQESVAEPTEAPAEAPTAAPTEEPTPEPTEVPTHESATEVAGDIDWSTAYEGYFEREDIMSDNFRMSMDISQDGMTFGFVMAIAGGNTYMNYDFGGVALDLYADEEKIYTYTQMEGQEAWNYAWITTEEDVDSVISISDTSMVDTETFTAYAYYEEVTEDGIVYDVLSFTADDDGEPMEGYCYVNRETQKMSKMVVESEAGPMTIDISEIDSIEIPVEALNGTEVTMDDIVGTIFGVILLGALSGMEQ